MEANMDDDFKAFFGLVAILAVGFAIGFVTFGATVHAKFKDRVSDICDVVNAKSANIPPSQMDAAQKACFRYSGVKENKK